MINLIPNNLVNAKIEIMSWGKNILKNHCFNISIKEFYVR